MKDATVEKYYNEAGFVAILLSAGFGAGWSTWSGGNTEFMLMDKGLVEMALNEASEDDVDAYMSARFDINDMPYTGGWEGIYVEFLMPGTKFRVEEYDGAESLVTSASLEYTA